MVGGVERRGRRFPTSRFRGILGAGKGVVGVSEWIVLYAGARRAGKTYFGGVQIVYLTPYAYPNRCFSIMTVYITRCARHWTDQDPDMYRHVKQPLDDAPYLGPEQPFPHEFPDAGVVFPVLLLEPVGGLGRGGLVGGFEPDAHGMVGARYGLGRTTCGVFAVCLIG